LPRLWRWIVTSRDGSRGRRLAFALAITYTIGFWIDIFRDHVALPSARDGVAHTMYYMRILQSGDPTLGRVPLSLGDIFGTQLISFYPTGSHALFAIVGGLWDRFGVISHAGVVKACFTLTVAALPWALAWFVRRLLPSLPWWMALALGLVAIPGFRFPVEAAHEGGASRLVAHLVLIPIYADVLTRRFRGWTWVVWFGLVLGVAFLMHPSGFVALAAILGWAVITAAAETPAGASRFVPLAGGAVAAIVGGTLALGLLKWNSGVAEPRPPLEPLALRSLAAWMWITLKTLLDPEYGLSTYKGWLLAAGLTLLVTQRRRLGLSWRVALFPLWMAFIVIVVLVASLSSAPGMALVSGAFWSETPRMVELLYESIGLAMAVAAWWLWRAIRRPSLASGCAVLIVAGAFASQAMRGGWVHRHMLAFDQTFHTPAIGSITALGQWVQNRTPADALLVSDLQHNEIWEAWTGRAQPVIYSECTRAPDCPAREDLGRDRLTALRARMVLPLPDRRCLTELDRFTRPVYFIIPSVFVSPAPTMLCKDARYLATVDWHAVIEYVKP
jgi:hypothetical protein